MRSFVFAALTAGVSATPVLAQAAGSFTGPRAEVLVGWDQPKADGESDSGVAYGVGVGYDFRLGGAVAGIEAEAADSTAKECAGETCLKAKRDLYAGGRIGARVGNRTLVYGKAGYTNARFGLESGDATVASENLDGVRVGAGLEHALGSRSFVKTEYRYSNYEQGVSRHQLLGGVGFRF